MADGSCNVTIAGAILRFMGGLRMKAGEVRRWLGGVQQGLAVMVGGFVGGIIREEISYFQVTGTFPWAVAVTNVIGALCLAVCLFAFDHARARPWVRLAVTTGFIGAMTTFSTLVTSAVSLFATHPLEAIALVSLTVTAGLGVFWSGQIGVRSIVHIRESRNSPRPTL